MEGILNTVAFRTPPPYVDGARHTQTIWRLPWRGYLHNWERWQNTRQAKQIYDRNFVFK